MRQNPFTTVVGGIVLVLVLAFLYFSFKFKGSAWVYEWIPQNISVGWVQSASARSDLLMPSCGVVVLDLKESSRTAIEQNGLQFFHAALQPRSKKRYSYRSWRESPLLESDVSLFRRGFSCASVDRAQKAQIWSALDVPGSYFSENGEAAILVSTTQRQVVFSYYFE